MKQVLGDKKMIFIFCFPALLLFSVFVLYPMANIVVMSFQSYSGVGYAEFIGFNNFERLLDDHVFRTANRNSIGLAFLTAFVDSFIAFIFAMLIVGLKPLFQKLYKIFFLIPFVLSIAVISQLWLAIYHPRFGILNAFLDAIGLGMLQRGWLTDPSVALVSVAFVGMWWIFGMQLLLFYTGYRTIPETYFEAAKIDGANYFQQTMKITIPLLSNIIKLSLVLTIVGGLYTFPQVFIMTEGGPGNTTMTIMMYMYRQVFSNMRFGLGSAIAFVAIVQTAILIALISLVIRILTKNEKVEF